MLLFHILSKNKGVILEYWLYQNLEKLTFKDKIVLFIRTNNNTDNTEEILKEWIEKQTEWKDIIFDSTNVPEKVELYGEHEWNHERFDVMSRLRTEGIQKAKELDMDYFVCDVDNYLLPETIESLLETNMPVVAPFLRHPTCLYSNFHHPVTDIGYFQESMEYHQILNQNEPGLHTVDLVHCTYLIRKEVFDKINYYDDTNYHEYVIFSKNLRKNNVPQVIDNRKIYGCVSFSGDIEEGKAYMEQLVNFA
jgi:hypothetical protein